MKDFVKLSGIIMIGMIMAISVTRCVQSTPENKPGDPSTNAAIPNISTHPTSRNYEPGDTIAPLSVTATVSDGGELSYQWYQNTAFSTNGAAAIEGETGTTYNVPQTQEEGDRYYYVVVTNHNENAERNKTATATSNIARIRVQAGSTEPPTKSITINASDKQQYVRGFGGMSSVLFRVGTGSASPDINVEELDLLFNKDGQIRLNMFRIPLYDEHDAIIANELPGGGSFQQDNSDYYDLVKLVNDNGGYVFACPWTPPAYFKTNNSLVGGGHVKRELYGELAQYFKEFLEKMAANRAPIFALSPQNEPNFTAAYEGCEYSPEEMRDFIKVLGPVLANTPGYGGGKATDKVWILTGESANTPTISNAALDDPESAQYINAIPRHYYGSVQVKYDKALDMGKEVWQTEFSDTTGLSNSLRIYTSTWSWVWQFLNWIDCSMRLNNESAFVWWYAKRFYSLIGDGQEGGPPPMTITNRGYAMAHFSRFAVDTTRVGITTSGIDNINNTTFSAQSAVPKCTAYESMDGNSYSLVIFTPAVSVNEPAGEGTGSTNLGDIRINLPDGFVASSAYALKTNINVKLADELVVLSADGKSADINVPANTIISVKFSK